jgi:hypothetical protein
MDGFHRHRRAEVAFLVIFVLFFIFGPFFWD